MNKLVATWHHPADVDLAGFDAAELLGQACRQLAGIPELESARALVEVAMAEVAARFDSRAEAGPPTRSMAGPGSG